MAAESASFDMYPFVRLFLLRYPLAPLSSWWLKLPTPILYLIYCHTLDHIETRIHWIYTDIGGDMGYQPQGNRLNTVYFNITRRGLQNGVFLNFLFQETNRHANNFLQWIYFAFSWIPVGKVWLCRCLGVKKYRAWTLSKSVAYVIHSFCLSIVIMQRTHFRSSLPLTDCVFLYKIYVGCIFHILGYIDAKFDGWYGFFV